MDQWQHDLALLMWKNKGFSFEPSGDGLMVQRLLDTIYSVWSQLIIIFSSVNADSKPISFAAKLKGL